MNYPIVANGELCDPEQTISYLAMLFRHVEAGGDVMSILGIGEKGTEKEAKDGTAGFRERKFVPLAHAGLIHANIRRWAEHHVASFIVPAVLHPSAVIAGDVTLDKIAAYTALVLDLDSGDVSGALAFVTERLGRPSMVVGSGGHTSDGEAKRHCYWLLNEPSDEVDRIAALRKLLAAKVGGDQSFGRATQVIRIPGSVHAKNGIASLCSILDQHDGDYSLDDLADIIETMEPMEGIEAPAPALPLLQIVNGMMDFSPGAGLGGGAGAELALHRDVPEGGNELTRWGEASKVIGFQISEARAGRITVEQALDNADGWMANHMLPAWPAGRLEQEFRRLLALDIKEKGALPVETAVTATAPSVVENIVATPFAWREPSTIPPRRWLFGRWLLRNTVTAIVAPGGVGKSSLMAAVMLSLTTGKPFLGPEVWDGPGRAWYWNLEDDGDEIARQIHATAIHHGISPANVADRLFINSGPDGQPLCTAIEDRGTFRILRPITQAIIDQIIELRIDSLTLDPFVSTHQVDENANTHIDAITKEWAYVAKATGCAIGLVHHTKKLAGQRAGAESARGATALVNTARSVLVLNRMTPEEGQLFGIERGREARYFSVQDDKHNRAPAEQEGWYQMASVELGNGDNVGVVDTWKPPSVLDGVKPEDVAELQRIASMGAWRKAATCKDEWFGDHVAAVLGLDLDDAAAKKRIGTMISLWLKRGQLVETMKTCKDRKKHKCIDAPPMSAPGNVMVFGAVYSGD